MVDEVKEHNSVYDRLVRDEVDILGQMAYSIYKRRKREFIIGKKNKLGRELSTPDALQEFMDAQTDYTLGLYRTHAEKLTREFLDASYAEQLSKVREQIELEYRQKYEDFIGKLQPKSWWYGVLQSFIASFLFVLAGYILLKMTGSWEKLLSIFLP